MDKPLVIAFGSRVTGRATDKSDYALGVFSGKPLSLEERSDMAERLAAKLGINEDKIDIVDLSVASPMLKFEAARKGKLIEGDEFDFIRFKVRAMKEYQNTAKFRHMREYAILGYHA